MSADEKREARKAEAERLSLHWDLYGCPGSKEWCERIHPFQFGEYA